MHRTYGVELETASQSDAVAHANLQLANKGFGKTSGFTPFPYPSMVNTSLQQALSFGMGVSSSTDLFHTELVPLKGIDVLSNGRYRVQLNTFMSGRKKFSRNSTNLYEVSLFVCLLMLTRRCAHFLFI